MSTATLLGAILLPIAFIWALPLLSEIISIAVVAARPLWKGQPVKELRSNSPSDPRTRTGAQRGQQIESCVRSLLGMRTVASELTVIVLADNCVDETAAVARATGVRVLERTDRAQTGKPRAIAWALQELALAMHSTRCSSSMPTRKRTRAGRRYRGSGRPEINCRSGVRQPVQ